MTRRNCFTGTCFDDAMELLMQFAKADRCACFLVHAICSVPRPDGQHTLYSHAWIEFKGRSYTMVLNNDGERAVLCGAHLQLRGKLGVQQSTRYSVDEVIDLQLEHGCTGPWEPQYIALCHQEGDSDAPLGSVEVALDPRRHRH